MVKQKSNKNNKIIELPTRLILIIIGMSGLIYLFVYSINFETTNTFINIFGYNITTYFYAGFVIIFGLILSSILKSGLLGKWKMD